MPQFFSIGDPPLSQATAVGQAFNIYGAFGATSLMRPLFDFSKTGTHTFTLLGVDYLIPSIVNGIEQTSTYYLGGTALTRDAFQNSFAAHAKVDASYGAFSGQMEATYASEYQQSIEYAFSYRDFFSQLAYLQLSPDTSFLSADFQARIAQLPGSVSVDNLHIFEDFFNTFGIYFTSRITLGASLSFYVATQKTDQLSQQDVGVVFNAQYSGLFSSGSISSDIKNSSTWKNYSENSQIDITALGADPTLGTTLATLAQSECFNPTSATVNAYNSWLQSVKTDPAIIDFELTGIWELCGDRRNVVQEAWDAYGTQMRPRLVIDTSTSDAPTQPYSVPGINIGYVITPKDAPQYSMGYQVVVLDGASDITTPAAVLHNQYYSIDSGTWAQSYTTMYDKMYQDLAPYTQAGKVLILAGFNLKWNATPTPNFRNIMMDAGAGDQTNYWVYNSHPGATSVPANVIFVGIFEQGQGTAIEYIQLVGSPIGVVTGAQLEVLFYRRTNGNGYTLSEGDRS